MLNELFWKEVNEAARRADLLALSTTLNCYPRAECPCCHRQFEFGFAWFAKTDAEGPCPHCENVLAIIEDTTEKDGTRYVRLRLR